ncbi:MAG: hypothetical protein ACK4SA_05305 [Caldilinea sp.]
MLHLYNFHATDRTIAIDKRMKRIVIVGTTGSGKSTLAEQLACLLLYPFVELDALFWGQTGSRFRTWSGQFASCDSLFVWALKTRYRRRCLPCPNTHI